MESRIIVCEKAFIPWFKEFPFEETEAWGRALRDSIPKTEKGTLNAVPDNKAFRKKIGDPTIASVDKMLKDDFVSRKGLSKEEIIRIMNSKLYGKKSAKNYRKNLKRALKTFDQGELNSAMVGYQRGQSFGEYRFREAIELALGWLTPYINPAKQDLCAGKLMNQLMSSGILISDLAYDPEYFKPENDKTNSLINEYIREDIVPFKTGGASHMDFVLIPESVTPANSKEVTGKKYKIYKRFLGEEQANKLRATWIIMDESLRPPNPNDYMGNHTDLSKQAYFDMNLDIQVSNH
jgi:hypothetical protein